MKKYTMITMVVAVILLLPVSSVLAIYNWSTEMTEWDPDKCQNGYNLFTTQGKAWLLDMEGRIVHEWEPAADMDFGAYAFLMENGNLRTANAPPYVPSRNSGSTMAAGGVTGRIEEYDWDGNRVWYMDLMDGVIDDGAGGLTTDLDLHTWRAHHDYQLMYNSDINEWTYMVLIWVAKDQQDAINIGAAPDTDGDYYASSPTGATWSPCALIEILPDYESGEGGDIIWYWSFSDHMVTTDPSGTAATSQWTDWGGRTSRPPTVVTSTDADTDSIRANPQLLDVNGVHYTVASVPRVDYQHCNSFDYDENTGLVAINAKACNEFFVIDHDNTFDASAAANDWSSVGALARGTGGDFLYRFGNPANYYSGEPAGWYDEGDMEMYGTHDIQFIMDNHWRAPRAGDTWSMPTVEMALPGAGNFLMFDNGCYNPLIRGSKILEVNPYIMDGNGNEDTAFVDPGPDAVNGPGLSRRDQVVWVHGEANNRNINNFYSSYISSTQRMPNGNTLVCAGSHGHFFEATPDNEIVWEYIVPPPDGTGFATVQPGSQFCFRFHRFLSSHPALIGKDLTPGATLTGREPAEVGTVVTVTPEAPTPAPTGWGTSGLTAGEGGGGSAGGTGSGSAGSY